MEIIELIIVSIVSGLAVEAVKAFARWMWMDFFK